MTFVSYKCRKGRSLHELTTQLIEYRPAQKCKRQGLVDVLSNDNRVVLQQTLTQQANSIDISELPVGAYLVKLHYNGLVKTH